MSSSKPKKVHYSSSAKGGKSSSGHKHRDSRDSGVGSSSASDRASLGTSPNESPFNSQEIYTQRHNPSALNEALDAANEEIRMLRAEKAQLEDLLAESNRENRALKKERNKLEDDKTYLKNELKQEEKLNDRLKSRRSSPSNADANTIANSSAPRTNERPPLTNPRPTSRRFSSSGGAPPLAPQPPPNNTNPFTPLNERPGAFAKQPPQVSYSASITPSTVSYTPSSMAYTPVPQSPVYTTVAHRPNPKRNSQQERLYPNDGKYHPYPV
ncbi:hypothetical protein GLAREA_02522 [Glarea lozoyensis ATCC 20868]|uniref:Uncharacterized protein n=1 Tax=Glarea lozoyensis (strain ATCC 20868 / MF5171) TaxID=1116229 RepID=S3CN28_GLAL2|nr:uncharacterized protein GLAREA_02522 [Glarea lozoyensis ATCC 20868]EPE26609.1 hypothetical protein GLAREA_02522 [Glarea lozoyensis ATCC 20868]